MTKPDTGGRGEGRIAFSNGPWSLGPEAIGDVFDADGRLIAKTDGWNVGTELTPAENRANARLIAAAPYLFECAELLEKAEEVHANCDECEGEGVPELCEKCFPLFDFARMKRRAAFAALQAQGDER